MRTALARETQAITQTWTADARHALHPMQPSRQRSFVELDLGIRDLIADRSVRGDLRPIRGVGDEICVEWRLALGPQVRMYPTSVQPPSTRTGVIEVHNDLADRLPWRSRTESALTVMPLQEIEVPGDPVASPPSGIAEDDGCSDLARELHEGVLFVLGHRRERHARLVRRRQGTVLLNRRPPVNERVARLEEAVI